MYFSGFPNIPYVFDIAGSPETRMVKDITFNVRVRQEILKNITLYDEYDIQDGETPEIIAHKVYGSSEYHWVVMLCNERFDAYEDFPLPSREFEQYVTEKYGNTLGDTHHYEYNGFVVMGPDPDDPDRPDVVGAEPISNYDYELRLNESKRRIKLIAPSLIAQIKAQLMSFV